MSNRCQIKPSKGQVLFDKLKSKYGRHNATKIFLQAINPHFIQDYSSSLVLDEEGVPSYESLMDNEHIKNFIGLDLEMEALQKEFKPTENTIDNYIGELNNAKTFNDNHSDFVAVVRSNSDGKLQTHIVPKNKANIDEFNDQYSAHLLTQKLVSELAENGITYSMLSKEEEKAGRLGVTRFQAAKNIATGIADMIAVANSKEGYEALTEEASHVILGVNRKEPIVERTISALSKNESALRAILGDEYEDTVSFHNGNMELVAEEAAGQILRDNLNSNSRKAQMPSLFERFIEFIKSFIRKMNLSDPNVLIAESNYNMSKIARETLSGLELTADSILKAEREAMFNALDKRIERNIKILREGAETEARIPNIIRGQISIKEKREANADEILSYADETADTVLGLFEYGKLALSELTLCNELMEEIRNGKAGSPAESSTVIFDNLRRVRQYLKARAPYIKSLSEAYTEEKNLEDNIFLREFGKIDDKMTLKDLYEQLNEIQNAINKDYNEIAKKCISEFLSNYTDMEIEVPFGPRKGEIMKVEDMLNIADHDISFFDYWLDAMGDTDNLLFQVLAEVVKKAKDKAKDESEASFRTIRTLMLEAESLGITDFDWMFERYDNGRKTGNYISSINYAQFLKDQREFEEYLTEKYGDNPTGDKAMEKSLEMIEWDSKHLEDPIHRKPNKTLYHNKDYDKLTTNQHNLLAKFLLIKEDLDKKFGYEYGKTKAVQIRKGGYQRLHDAKTIGELWDSVRADVQNSLLVAEDDEDLFGNRADLGVRDFDGEQHYYLAKPFQNRLKDPEELSTDVFGTLMQYAYAACTFSELDKVIDPLEVTRRYLKENLNVVETKNGHAMVDQIKTKYDTVESFIFKSKNNNRLLDKLDEFFECQVYLKYMKDNGTIFDTNISANKLASALQYLSATAQLGFNGLANIANIATGIGMQNIEAACGQYFTAGELASADKEYIKRIGPCLKDHFSRVQENDLDLLGELFDVKMEFKKLASKNMKSNLLERFFGETLAFLGQTAGDHWLYFRTAIAMMKHTKVMLNDKEISVWDAIEDATDDSGRKYKRIKDGVKMKDGSEFNAKKFGRQIGHINQSLFGIYNDEDKAAAYRTILGSFIMMYRKWIKPQFNKRFMAGQQSVVMGEFEEGYWRTLARVVVELHRGGYQIGAQWNSLTDTEKANLRRCLTELLQSFALYMLSMFIDWPDDEDGKGITAFKIAEYIIKRESHEIGFLNPLPVIVINPTTGMPYLEFPMLTEGAKTIKSPSAVMGQVDALLDLIKAIATPDYWNNEIASGPYRGMSTLNKAFHRSGIPPFSYFFRGEAIWNGIDNQIRNYDRKN